METSGAPSFPDFDPNINFFTVTSRWICGMPVFAEAKIVSKWIAIYPEDSQSRNGIEGNQDNIIGRKDSFRNTEHVQFISTSTLSRSLQVSVLL